MRRFLAIPLALSLLLSACSGSAFKNANTAMFTMSFDVQDNARKAELSTAAARVMERRLIGLNETPSAGDVSVQGDTITVKAKGAKTLQELKDQLAVPFNFRIMVAADKGTADITSDKYGSYKETGVTEKQVDWIQTKDSVQEGKSAALISFTPEGVAILKQVFTQNQGKEIGIFLRGVLMTRKILTKDDIHDTVTIEGIPSKDLASVFADDVNVGRHVNFTEVK